ncbi:MAG: HD domain-containing phosphohydrolase [Phycisphaerales bacterium]
MADFRRLRPTVRAYVSVVVLLGAATLGHSIHSLFVRPIGSQWLILAALTLLTGSFTVKVPSVNAHISVSETFVFASVLLFGPAAGAVTVLLECLIILFWMKPHGRPAHRVLFNLAAPSVAIWVSGQAFFLLSGIEPYATHSTPLPALFFPLVAFTCLYFLLNSGLVAVVVGLENRQSPLVIWWENFTWLSVNYFSGASVAALIVTYTTEFDLSTLAVIVPLLVVSYLTFRTAMGRVDDTNRHLTELNRLYLSTIETLAMAIDAKDQITHGHIRRVQTYAVGLAARVGVSDQKLIRAIEAAALLHDMGKLAVPEYILNKPGKLTPAEFEKMKLHASVGADILSAIEFPYPVVPIVRHHHENWDGSGYPAGLKGTDIPIGARILSVVDCFDALTSDRPYRPRLSDTEAIAILLERRGSMYDPLIVDTFIRVHAEISTPAEPLTAGAALREITTAASRARDGDRHMADTQAVERELVSRSAALQELAKILSGPTTAMEAADEIAAQLGQAVPASLVVFFTYDDSTDLLVAAQASGDGATLVRGMRIPLGHRLSGWVAANKQTIVNSDAMLDLGEIAKSVTPRLRTCLSTPLLVQGQLYGVLTLYSSAQDAFSDAHRAFVESAAKELSLGIGARPRWGNRFSSSNVARQP